MEKTKEASYSVHNPAWIGRSVPKLPEDENIAELVAASAKKWPNKTALVCYDREMSYSELDDLISRLASALINDFGIKKGDRVATMMPNCIQHSISYFAITRAGAVNTPINVMYRERELEYQLNDSGAETIIALDIFLPLIQKVKDTTPLKNIIISNLRDFTAPDANIPSLLDTKKTRVEGTHDLAQVLDKASPKLPEIKINTRWDLAQILYTAGTTAPTPKGVMIAHFLAWSTTRTLQAIFAMDENTVDLQIMPMFHCSGFTLGQMPTLASGGTVVHFPLFRDPKELLDFILKYKVNVLLGPPTLYIALLNVPEVGEADMSFFKSTTSAGAHTPDYVIDKWRDMTGLTLVDGLGLTELNCGGHISGGAMNFPNRFKPNTLGLPFSSLKIVDGEGNIVPRGELGEMMFLWGGNCLKGYWNKPEETLATWTDDGWIHTGDTCYMDEDGFVIFADRSKDIVVASGYNVAPSEVENEILKHPGVFEVAVVGVSDPYRGETLKAFVVLKEESKGKVTGQEITDFCKDKMATFKVPRQVEFIDAIPKNPVGKVLRRELRDRESKAKAKEA